MHEEKFNIEASMPYKLGIAVQYIKNALYKEFKNEEFNITTEQWSVLASLHVKDGLYQKQIADCLLKDKPTVTRILDLLEKRNLVIRIPDDKDRRKFKIYLTQEGKELVNKLEPIAVSFENSFDEILLPGEKQILFDLLDKLSEKFCGSKYIL